MKRQTGSRLAAATFAATAVLATTTATTAATAATPAKPATSRNFTDVCGPAAPGQYRCQSLVRTDVHGGFGVRGATAHTALPTGYGPADLHSAYKLPWHVRKGAPAQTIAIVDAFDDPSAEADLAAYRQTYGLRPCTTANGCFAKINQSGATSPLPQADPGWAVEISLDLDMASAACPDCHIMLVEGTTPSFDDLATAVDTAVAQGATVVSNSYGATEYAGDPHAADYDHPGVPIVASSGDSGYGIAQVPAVYPSVIAVGGTALTRADNARGWQETAWGSFAEGGGAGSGCSGYYPKPAWQHDRHCPTRTTSDVSAVADPATGVAVYDSFGASGWIVVGGTSASSPIIAGVIALAGNGAQIDDASYLYAHKRHLYDVVGGTNGLVVGCGGDYLCTGKKGYDGPTGLGTPRGLGSF